MKRLLNHNAYRGFFGLVLISCLLAAGCGSPDAKFRLNHVYAAVQEQQNSLDIDERQLRNVDELMVALFGTPDDPKLPVLADLDVSQVCDERLLQISAGPVKRENVDTATGLYREHCAHCHGISGDGAGPTAGFLNPYPRDYRKGVFKFKSTPRTIPPTTDDLHRVLYEGIPGTAMPSFKLLPRNELESLVHYVRYLAIRGEVERQLIYALVSDLDEGELLFDQVAAEADQEEQLDYVRGIVAEVVQKWIDAETQATPVPPRPDVPKEESIAKGRELFFGATANCVKCHGPTALGDGVINDYDEWTKELNRNNAASEAQIADLVSLGAFPVRPIRPRNLRMNVYRGGRRPVDLYWRIHNGIAGSPMPAASMRPDGAPENDARLTTDDIWHLIDYVRSLPNQPLSEPANSQPTNERVRN